MLAVWYARSRQVVFEPGGGCDSLLKSLMGGECPLFYIRSHTETNQGSHPTSSNSPLENTVLTRPGLAYLPVHIHTLR